MPRYALKIDYDGRPFHGWQTQPDRPSVQSALLAALQQLEQDAGPVYGAGRTDAGVHATGQVAHVDLTRDWAPFRLAEAVNFHLLPDPVAVVAAARVTDAFHVRFDAVERRYLYRIRTRRAPLTHDRGLVWRIKHELDADAMAAAAGALIGQHDFTTFRSSSCQAKSPVKTLDAIDVRVAADEIRFFLRARSFLHNQVRSIVGTLERVGAGAWAPSAVAEALAARDRAACGPMAPPDGLYLTEVIYPENPFSDWGR